MRFTRLLAVVVLMLASAASGQVASVSLAVQVSAVVSESPASITLSWPAVQYATAYSVYRRAAEATTWGPAIATLSATTLSYVDSNVTVGTAYEYKVFKTGTTVQNPAAGYIWAGIRLPAIESRGKLVLIVDKTNATALATELAQLQQDMVGDGWQVIRHDVNRADSVASVRQLIVADYQADPANVKSVFLFGHVPVPYSGDISEGHDEHLGAWPADVYYGDMTGTWTDTTVNRSTATDPRNRNIPGDGKFDQSILSKDNELQVGRVDLAGMSYNGGELALLRNYCRKDHAFRHKQVTLQRRGVLYDYFGPGNFTPCGWRSMSAMFGAANITEVTVAGTLFPRLQTEEYLVAYCSGGGWIDSMEGSGNYRNSYWGAIVGTSQEIVERNIKVAFFMMYGSWFIDWDQPNDLMRAVLATPDYGLVSMCAGKPQWLLHPMALGKDIGYCARLTQNNLEYFAPNLTYEQLDYPLSRGMRSVHAALMGDPTLRLHAVMPVTNVAAVNGTGNLAINWTASTDTVVGYHVYRSPSTNGPFTRLTANVVTGTSYTDATVTTGTHTYMVRAVKLETSASGSYYNLSQGITKTTTYAAPVAAIQGRQVFYNGSKFDKNSSAANSDDDAAIATDKEALLPGGVAAFKNYTSYSKGLNGVMVDIANLPGAPTAADFGFRVGNSSTPDVWSAGPAPTSITVRAGAGVGGSARVTLIWADNAIQKQWLEVTVKASTGLASADVFYFGNVIGETGNSVADANVDLVDLAGVRANQSGFGTVGVGNAYDLNRDGHVDLVDLALVRGNQSGFTPVKLISPPAASGLRVVATGLSSVAAAPVAAVAPELLAEDTSRPGVVGRWVFYNNSKFDRNQAATNGDDDGAIAADKEALLPGWAASFKNYTSYSRGINGVMVDIRHLAGTPTVRDLVLHVGNDNTPGAWPVGPAPASVTVRKSAGVGGSDRVTVLWKDNAVQKQWLQITVKATSRTGLTAPDVFYFGNAIGETGNVRGNAIVDTADVSGAKGHLTSSAPITSAYDFDRSGAVDAADAKIAESNRTSARKSLSLINPVP